MMGTSQFAHTDPMSEGIQPTGATSAETWSSPEAARQALERYTEQLLTLASHELRTPLTTIGGNIQLALRRLASCSSPDGERDVVSAVELLNRAKRQLDRLNALIDKMISAQCVYEGRLPLHLAPADLAAIVLAEVEQHRLLWPGRAITIAPRAVEDGATWLVVNVDVDHITQVIANFLSNALKFSPAHTPVVLRLERRDNQAHIAVSDMGPGLPPEEHARVWERFYRVPGIRELNGSTIGFGLGLYICREIATLHGGTVGIESAPGQGSTFWCALDALPLPATSG